MNNIIVCISITRSYSSSEYTKEWEGKVFAKLIKLGFGPKDLQVLMSGRLENKISLFRYCVNHGFDFNKVNAILNPKTKH